MQENYNPVRSDHTHGEVRTVCDINQSCELTKCLHCGEIIPHDEVEDCNEYEGNKICEDCYCDNFSTCDECGSVEYSDECVWFDEQMYCATCARDNLVNCASCGENGLKENSIRAVAGWICEDCIESCNYGFCDSCSEYYVSQDSLTYCEHCDQSHCDDCACDCALMPDNGYCFRYLKTNKPGLIVKSLRLVGIEIEAEEGKKSELSELSKDCNIEEDGSLDETGVEVVTNPAGGFELEELIKHASKVMIEAGFEGTDSCGLHTHIDARDFKDRPGKIARLFKTVYAIEPIILSMLPIERRSNSFCHHLRERYRFFDMGITKSLDHNEHGWYKGGDKRKDSKWGGNESHYMGLNLHSIAYRGSVEFRYHEGTVDANEMLNWANFLTQVVDYANKKYCHKDIISLMNTPTPRAIDKMVKVLGLTEETKNYIKSRVSQFC